LNDLRDKCDQAFELYRHRPSKENGAALCTAVDRLIMTKELAILCPSLAMLEVTIERNHTGHAWWGIFAMKLAAKMLRKRIPEWRVGWNDYYMTRWLLTQDQHSANEIHRRAAHVPDGPSLSGKEDWGAVGHTAKWMASTQREINHEFDEALKVAEQNCWVCHSNHLVEHAAMFKGAIR
jgi:hypothetical protein